MTLSFKILKTMPRPLVGLFFLFLLTPLTSLVLYGQGFSLASPGEILKFVFWLCAYGVLPIALCYSLAVTHHWFLPLYLSFSALLALQLPFGEHFTLFEIGTARYLLIGSMLYVGILFGNRNFLYPLLTKNPRLWRGAVRYRIGRNVRITIPQRSGDIPAFLEDCSATGLALSIQPADMPAELVNSLQAGISLLVAVQIDSADSRSFVIPAQIVWLRGKHGEEKKLGCRSLDRKVMRRYLDAEILKKEDNVKTFQWNRDEMLERYMQKTALVLWLVCAGLLFVTPTFTP